MSVCVNVSGTAFSLLLYENVRNDYDQEGFLLGEVIRNEKRTITDNDQEVVSIEHTIKINSVLPCPRLGYFYDNAGRIDATKIAGLLGDKRDRVVSWYKFKRISSFKPTLREKIVMKQLAAHCMPRAPEHFTWCLLTAPRAGDAAIAADAKHVFSQTFIRYHMSAYQPLPMHIANLKDPHDTYRKPAACSATFADVLRALPKPEHGYATIDGIETALDARIAATVAALEASENEMHELEAIVHELRRKVNSEEVVLASESDASLEDKENPKCLPTTSRNRRSLRSTVSDEFEKNENTDNHKNDQVLSEKIGEATTKENISGRTRYSGRKS